MVNVNKVDVPKYNPLFTDNLAYESRGGANSETGVDAGSGEVDDRDRIRTRSVGIPTIKDGKQVVRPVYNSARIQQTRLVAAGEEFQWKKGWGYMGWTSGSQKAYEISRTNSANLTLWK
ncbi:hypothetical protein KQX54_019196 [Cotesia glomerata]|uniref:Uncharacterized protein n=1 Tax=Cotesia glomerata TaxID=32391 RepID=A0AAV7IBD6_COTGL|nr:hypothetical protein KQX54_019196 [Cotesia glomerata]